MSDNAKLIEQATSIFGLMDDEMKKYKGVTLTTSNAALALLRPFSAALAASEAEVKRLREVMARIQRRNGVPTWIEEVILGALAPEAK